MTSTTVPGPTPKYDIFKPGRPGWIPEWVGDDWDPDPYAYQTREQLMPAGRFYSLYLKILAQLLDPLLERRGLELALDVFLFYRDWEQRKQRVAPDALIAQAHALTRDQMLKSYDLDDEPLPLCVVEVTSPSSQLADRQEKRLLYAMLGINEYLLVDTVDDADADRLRSTIDLYLWRVDDGLPAPVAPDAEGYLTLETIGVRLRSEGHRLVAQVLETGEFLRTATELTVALESTETLMVQAEIARREAETRLAQADAARHEVEIRMQQEAAARAEAEARVSQANAARAEAEARVSQADAARAEAEAEVAALRAELARLRGEH